MSTLSQDHESTSGIFDPGIGEQFVVEPKPPDLGGVFQHISAHPSSIANDDLVTSSPPSSPFPSTPTSSVLTPFLNVNQPSFVASPLSTTTPSEVAASTSVSSEQATATGQSHQSRLAAISDNHNAVSNSTTVTKEEREDNSSSSTNVNSVVPPISRVRNYIVLGDVSVPGPNIFPAVDTSTGQRYTCKVIAKRDYPESLRANYIMDSSEYVMNIEAVVISTINVFAFFKRGECDLQSFMQKKRLLKEDEVKRIFEQVVNAVHECHQRGIIVKDLKMKKIIITDMKRFTVKLESLDGAKILEDEENDLMTDRLGCPAYVSPELLKSSPEEYSGKKCDMWSLGIILFALLVGRYPFYDKEPVRMLAKINRGRFHTPERVSWLAKSVIHSLLVCDPEQRMSAQDVLWHPWFRDSAAASSTLPLRHRTLGHVSRGGTGSTGSTGGPVSLLAPPHTAGPTPLAPLEIAHLHKPSTTTTDHMVPDFNDRDTQPASNHLYP